MNEKYKKPRGFHDRAIVAIVYFSDLEDVLHHQHEENDRYTTYFFYFPRRAKFMRRLSSEGTILYTRNSTMVTVVRDDMSTPLDLSIRYSTLLDLLDRRRTIPACDANVSSFQVLRLQDAKQRLKDTEFELRQRRIQSPI